MKFDSCIVSWFLGNQVLWFRIFRRFGLNINWEKNKFISFSERNKLKKVYYIGNIRVMGIKD